MGSLPTAWITDVRNNDTGFLIDLGLPVPEGSNLRMSLQICVPGTTNETPYWAGVQLVPHDDMAESVAWQDEAYFVLKNGNPYVVSVQYQTVPREPGHFDFYPRLFSAPGGTEDQNVIVTGPEVEFVTCKPGGSCNNGLNPSD